jgi:uncharacterized membrane protein YeaQ/YmgE (transglycosylase-associated protein family)
MGFISTIIIGVIVGIIAKVIMPGKNDPGGFVMTAIIGIVGAMLAGYFGQMMGWYADGQGAGWIMSIIGACVVLFAYSKFFGNRTQA